MLLASLLSHPQAALNFVACDDLISVLLSIPSACAPLDLYLSPFINPVEMRIPAQVGEVCGRMAAALSHKSVPLALDFVNLLVSRLVPVLEHHVQRVPGSVLSALLREADSGVLWWTPFLQTFALTMSQEQLREFGRWMIEMMTHSSSRMISAIKRAQEQLKRGSAIQWESQEEFRDIFSWMHLFLGPACSFSPAVNFCAVCNKPGKLMRCSKCHNTWYCGAECQAKDWPSHKQRCVPSVRQHVQNKPKTKGAAPPK